jgi:hypothetical protein
MHVLFILLYIHIKFRVQIPNNEEAVKKTKFLTYLKLEIYQKFLFFVIDKQFELEILYTDRVV